MTTWLIKRSVTQRVVKIGEPIPLRHKRGKLAGAPYNVVNTSSITPGSGQLYIPPSGLTLRINGWDLAGNDNTAYISTLRAGDTINIGAVPAVLAGTPIFNMGVVELFVVALPVVADGNYIITVTKA
jgi:hypothetical protein